jgi:transcriptional regulator with GAF, ATPase, and Fis domain
MRAEPSERHPGGASRAAEPHEPAPQAAAAAGAQPTALEEVARQHMLQVLERCGWVIDGEGGAARILGLSPSTLRSRLKRLGLQRPSRAAGSPM